MNSVLLRLLAAALAAVLTFEAPAPVRPGLRSEAPGLLMRMELTQDIRACIRLGVQMELGPIFCSRSEMNNQCTQEACPFHREGTK